MKKVSEFMVEVPLVRTEDTVTRARQLLRDEGFREIYVQDSHRKIAGYIDISDVLRVNATKSNVTVEGYVKEAPVAGPDDRVEDAARTIRKFKTDSAAVVDGERHICGGVLLSDIFPVIITRNELRGTVGDAMSRKVVTCGPEDSITKIYTLVVDSGYTAFPVVNKKKLVGMVSRRDLLNGGRIRKALDQHANTTAQEIMTKDVITTTAGESLARAAELMVSHDISLLPVMEGAKIAGIIDRHDILGGLAPPSS